MNNPTNQTKMTITEQIIAASGFFLSLAVWITMSIHCFKLKMLARSEYLRGRIDGQILEIKSLN